MSETAAEAVQGFEISPYVELFELDLSTIAAGAPTLRFTPQAETSLPVSRGSVEYVPVPVKLEGLTRRQDGAPPQPSLSVGAVVDVLGPWVWSGQDLIGAELTRIVVLAQWLDGGSDEDSTRYLQTDTFEIGQKMRQTGDALEFRLVSPFDQGDLQIPRRQILPDSCLFRYREWNGSSFDYFDCPYTGSSYFDTSGASTTQANDQCSRKLLTGCAPRYPSSARPITAFPGIGRGR